MFGDGGASELWQYIPDEEILIEYENAMGSYFKYWSVFERLNSLIVTEAMAAR